MQIMLQNDVNVHFITNLRSRLHLSQFFAVHVTAAPTRTIFFGPYDHFRRGLLLGPSVESGWGRVFGEVHYLRGFFYFGRGFRA